MNTASSLDRPSSVWSPQTLHVNWPWSWCGFQTDLTAACWHCRKTSGQKKKKFSRLKPTLKSCAAACENSRAILGQRSLEYRYLIKERVVPPLDPGPVGLSTRMDFHHGFDVVARQLTGLNDPNTYLREKKAQRWQNQWENRETGAYRRATVPTQVCRYHEDWGEASWISRQKKVWLLQKTWIEFLFFSIKTTNLSTGIL